MFGALSNALGSARDRAVEAAARSYIARKIEKFGELRKLEIDSRQKRLAMEVALKGEVSPVSLQVDRYEIVQRDGESHIILRQARASREWITAALEEHVLGREFKLPPSAASVL